MVKETATIKAEIKPLEDILTALPCLMTRDMTTLKQRQMAK
jgi:hypothetical protein